ncbi:hypothetical protein [Paenibacillus sp. FSL H3-0457]|uniref:hypothetical protein n=1 Tax=Paenibacillus sp. FSL H3-0457 TaxID=2921430 RepID=UPI0030ECA4E8
MLKHECQKMKEYGHPVNEMTYDPRSHRSWELDLGFIHDGTCTLFVSYCPFCGEKLNTVNEGNKERIKPVVPTVPQMAHDLDVSLHMIGVEMTKVNPDQEIINKLFIRSKNWAIALNGTLNKF